jgi:hypothetical protein
LPKAITKSSNGVRQVSRVINYNNKKCVQTNSKETRIFEVVVAAFAVAAEEEDRGTVAASVVVAFAAVAFVVAASAFVAVVWEEAHDAVAEAEVAEVHYVGPALAAAEAAARDVDQEWVDLVGDHFVAVEVAVGVVEGAFAEAEEGWD